jgi:hypothetical protein
MTKTLTIAAACAAMLVVAQPAAAGGLSHASKDWCPLTWMKNALDAKHKMIEAKLAHKRAMAPVEKVKVAKAAAKPMK